MSKNNSDVREKARNAGVYLWEVADKIGMQDSNFSRMLRRELPPGMKAKIFTVIEELRKEKQAEPKAASQ